MTDDSDKQLYVKTTLRELIIYFIFLMGFGQVHCTRESIILIYLLAGLLHHVHESLGELSKSLGLSINSVTSVRK